MRSVARLGIQPVAGAAGSVQGAVRVFAQGIAALDDKAWDDAMEGGAIIEFHLDELDKVLDMARRVIGVEANFDLTEGRRDGDAGIDFLELHRHCR